jgi:hypothetical protein
VDLVGIPMPGATAKAGQRSDREVDCELGDVQVDPTRGIQRIEVKGDPKAVGFTFDIQATAHGQSGSKSGSTAGGTPGRIVVTHLEVDDLQCETMKGHLDAAHFKDLTGGWVTDMRILENSWTASRVQSDD